MSDNLPIRFKWDGEWMIPASLRQLDTCNKQYVVGQFYTLADWEDRSLASHGHQFAWLAEAWRNLPENIADEYPTPEHLRKRALIQAGYYDEQIIDAGSKAAALRVASAIQIREPFSLVIVRGALVVIRAPKSQSRHAMNAKEFQDSKTKVLEIVSALIGVKPEELTANADKAA